MLEGLQRLSVSLGKALRGRAGANIWEKATDVGKGACGGGTWAGSSPEFSCLLLPEPRYKPGQGYLETPVLGSSFAVVGDSCIRLGTSTGNAERCQTRKLWDASVTTCMLPAPSLTAAGSRLWAGGSAEVRGWSVLSLCTGGKMLFSWLFKVMLCPSKNSAQLREGNIKQGQCRLGLSVGSTAERERAWLWSIVLIVNNKHY